MSQYRHPETGKLMRREDYEALMAERATAIEAVGSVVFAPPPAPAPEETITVARADLEALIERKIAARLAEMADPAPAPVAPAPPERPFWVFLHRRSPGHAIRLPEELRSRTQDGYVHFRPDVVVKSKYRTKRGRFVTDDEAIGSWLLAETAQGHFPDVFVDDEATRLKLMTEEIALANA